jgi:SET domain-containing protein
MLKRKLLGRLQKTTYIHLLPSAVHGIGVFALRDIPKGCKDMFGKDLSPWVRLSFDEVERLPLHSKSMIENFCLYDESDYFVPAHGFTSMDLSLFLNHSDTPNIASQNEGAYFVALKNIKAGEELLVDYGQLVDF